MKSESLPNFVNDVGSGSFSSLSLSLTHTHTLFFSILFPPLALTPETHGLIKKKEQSIIKQQKPRHRCLFISLFILLILTY